ncbi:uncharacterized protein KGF55_000907 [Candida pseudojiufengensis]|uniref:uncharacterized protein n=1 Tax=Candida pseudojiufengensis TaxID=497109 RepID=UPI002225B51B|nr:uncharacterized protein KGF55_000907 [Candida pseudojiufengensis]KAI5965545.1 hypothetical protein KGF55_000907 [Candida pseudojiufengensis]
MLFKKKSQKHLNLSNDTSSPQPPNKKTIKKSTSARNLLNKLTNNNSSSSSSTSTSTTTTLKISTPISPPISNNLSSPLNSINNFNINNFINLTPINNQSSTINNKTTSIQNNEKLQITTPLHQLTLLEQNPQYKASFQTSESKISTEIENDKEFINEVEIESLVGIYTPKSNNMIEDAELTLTKEEQQQQQEESEEDYKEVLDKEKFLSGNFSTSTSQQNSPTNSKYSLTETNIQIYKRSHYHKSLNSQLNQNLNQNQNSSSKYNSLHLINNNECFKSPTKFKSESIKAGLIDITSQSNNSNITTTSNNNNSKEFEQISKLYELEILLLKEKHHYEIKQLKREIEKLKKLNSNENEKFIYQKDYDDDNILLPPFKPIPPNDDDNNSLLSLEDSIMSLYNDDYRKISESSTIASVPTPILK